MTTYVQDPVTRKFVEKSAYLAQVNAPAVHVTEPFVSPIDGTVIRDAAALRVHNRKHGVTDSRDYGAGYFEQKNKERGAAIQGQTAQDRQDRLNVLKHLTEDYNRR